MISIFRNKPKVDRIIISQDEVEDVVRRHEEACCPRYVDDNYYFRTAMKELHPEVCRGAWKINVSRRLHVELVRIA